MTDQPVGSKRERSELPTPQRLKVDEVLMLDPDAKNAFVLCTHPATSDKAIVCVNKQPWSEADLHVLLEEGDTELEEFHRNDKFSKYRARPPPRANEALVTLICPANEIDVAKYSQQERFVVRESAATYATVTKPHIESVPAKQTAWVRAILKREAEMDVLLYEDEHCMLLPDTKWDRKDVSALYTLAILKDERIKSLRDLNGSHVAALRTIREGCYAEVRRRFGVPSSKLRAYFHYLPSFWHAHIHFAALSCPAMGASLSAGKAVLLDDVIDCLERDGRHFEMASITFVVGARDALCTKLREAAAIVE
mmetsp:Transcript_19937/g.45989  ORF Transcript_19937/g.45989 Transcript_19937/m.45989 type:complete len:309 (-) Transcript_19937:737-1663(-)